MVKVSKEDRQVKCHTQGRVWRSGYTRKNGTKIKAQCINSPITKAEGRQQRADASVPRTRYYHDGSTSGRLLTPTRYGRDPETGIALRKDKKTPRKLPVRKNK